MEYIYVKDIICNGSYELEEALNSLAVNYIIKQVIFIGNNSVMQRIYQIICEMR